MRNNDAIIKEQLDLIVLDQSNESSSYFRFIMSITTICTALVGFLIGLKSQEHPNVESKYFFLLSICLLGLCILFSLVSRHYEIVEYNNLRQSRITMLTKLLHDCKLPQK
jgi:F0F1-type ATP synthase assembly protein I